MRYLLVALAALLLFPSLAEAKLYTTRPEPTISCDARVLLGVAASSHHKGSRQVRVDIRDARGALFYRRIVRTSRGKKYEWRKQLRPCGESFTIRYLFSAGRISYSTKVNLRSIPPSPVVNAPEVAPSSVPSPTPTPVPTPVATPVFTPVPTPVPTPVVTPVVTPVPTPVATPVPTPEAPSTISLQSGDETQFIRMIWWRGPPEVEGDQRVPGSCSWEPGGGTCVNGAPPFKLFRPQHFELIGLELWMDVPQYQGGFKTFDHYPLPVRLVRTGCTFEVQHNRGRGILEFRTDPPGLEILPHTWTMTGALCSTFNPLSSTWVADLNTALAEAIPAGPYNRPPYPY